MLQQTERFQTEIKNYREAIEKITDTVSKLEAEKLLNNLISEVKKLDLTFTEMVYQKQLPSQGSEIREKITTLRKQLANKISKK
jgi:hypothetical protein